MLLHHMLAGIEYAPVPEDCEITGVTCDSRQAAPGSLFVAVRGGRFDGHDHAAEAVGKGAAAIVTERRLGLPREIVVPDSREAYSLLSGNWFGNPARSLKLIGVTGTNGKTTVTYIIKQIMESVGLKVGLIGTIQSEIGGMALPSKHTTPDPFQLHALLRRMADAGCEYAVMEVSSHALDQRRVAGLRFESAAFTNLTQDHLDYHGDMESYYQAKKRLFSQCGLAVVNLDDKYGRRLLEEAGSEKKQSFSRESDEADYTARDVKFTASESRFAMLSEGSISRVTIPMPGLFSVSNALAAAVLCMAAGIPREQVVAGLGSCRGVPGRLEVLDADTPYTVIRDYAHSPDSLEKVLLTVREFAPSRVGILFGCAGNRDRTKRPLMGEIVSRLADYCILTSDNPRDEDPMRIINDCLPGVRKHRTPCKVIPDRYEAIRWALHNAQAGDILLLAGKGHEDYQVLDFGTIFFDEKVIVRELLAKKDVSK